MMEFFDTISSFIDKVVTFVETLFENIQQSISEIQLWVSYLPTGLVVSAGVIIVLLVIFRILGR